MATDEPQPQRRIADKAIVRFKDRVRDLTRRHRWVSVEWLIADLNPLVPLRRGFDELRALAARP